MPLTYGADVERLGDPDRDVLVAHGLLDMAELWKTWAGARFAPAWQDVNLLEIPDDLRRGTMVADCLEVPDDFRVRFWGLDLVRAFEVELTGKRLSESDERGIMRSFRETAITVVREKKPQFLIHKITSSHGAERLFPVVRLPISDDGETVTKIMSVENIRMCLQAFAE